MKEPIYVQTYPMAYPMDAICDSCGFPWGDHVGIQCPDGGSFKMKREQIMKEIEANEKEGK